MAKQEWEKLMLSRQLNEIHEQIVKLRLEGKNDVALNLSEYAREIDDKLRSLWKC
ncbi:DNA primase domain protein [Anaplasma phagocytophilum str. ApNP]|uniref:DNA primase domain protein n=1 Tax=Anaplasma phagocytophilum str. ApNP TaxID=1359153 RepID=A0A0F3NHC2_ANAPH|nr:DNA primase domain protein [Anaplasma phagocytophilum str. ApNP]